MLRAFRSRARDWAAVAAFIILAGLLMLPGQGLAQGDAASPYQLSLVREGDLVAIGGAVPDEAVREAVLAAIRGVSADIAVIDTTEVRPGAPEGFAVAAPWAGALAARLKPGAVLLSGGEATVEGRPGSLAAGRAVNAALAALPPGYRILRQALAPALAKPFVLSMRREGAQVILEGAMAAEDEAAELGALAASLGLTADVSGLVVADGAPAGVDRRAAARFALLQLARLAKGRVLIEDGALSLEGRPADRAGFAAVNLALKAAPLPGGATLKSVSLAAPLVSPYRWFVERSPAGILIRGYVPGEEAGAAARAVVSAHFGTLALRDEQEIAAGAPEDFAAAVVAAVKQLYLLPQGRVTIEDRTLAVAGQVPSQAYANAVRGAVQRLAPAGFAVTHDIAAPPPAQPAQAQVQAQAAAPAAADTCMPKVREEMAAGGIVFQFGRETLRPESLARLKRIAAILKACPQTRLTVEGHTDSAGVPAQNVDLSQRRAQAVVTLLIREGIAAERLLAAGIGATRPVAPNDTAANRARNRRIEFVAR